MKKSFLYSRRVFFFLLGGLCQEVNSSLGIIEVDALSLLPLLWQRPLDWCSAMWVSTPVVQAFHRPWWVVLAGLERQTHTQKMYPSLWGRTTVVILTLRWSPQAIGLYQGLRAACYCWQVARPEVAGASSFGMWVSMLFGPYVALSVLLTTLLMCAKCQCW